MDEIERLIAAFRAHGPHDHSLWKLDVLMDLGRHDDPRAMQLYVAVVGDAEEPPDVRSAALRRLREAAPTRDHRSMAADAIRRALGHQAHPEVRLDAALALGDFVDDRGALGVLGAVAADPSEPIELRYNAFTSLQRAGPTAACLDILHALSEDETLGQSVRALLTSWGVS
jgi:hypothetical protein